MIYHPEDFAALSEAVIHEGGRTLPEECEGTKFRIKKPDTNGRLVSRDEYTTNCGFSARMEISYDPATHIRLTEDYDGVESEPITICDVAGDEGDGMAVVCACDDAVGLWPRFANVVSDRSYQRMWDVPRKFREQ